MPTDLEVEEAPQSGYMPKPVVVIARGGRELAWGAKTVRVALLEAVADRSVVAVFHGGARGADELVHRQARSLGWPVRVRLAQWSALGAAAGPIRNRAMVAEAGELAQRQGAELLVVAFPGGKGTASCVREARRWWRLSDQQVQLDTCLLAERIGPAWER